MGLAGETFNKIIFNSSPYNEIDDHCEEIYQNRRVYLREVRSMVKLLSTVPTEFAWFWELDSTKETLSLLIEFEKKCSFSINYEKGTVHLRRWKDIIEDFLLARQDDKGDKSFF